MNKKIKTIGKCIILLLFLISCKEKKESIMPRYDAGELKPKKSIIQFENLQRENDFNKIFKETGNIYLDTAKEGLLADIRTIMAYKEDLIVVDYFRSRIIKRYNQKGKFLGNIGKTGEGPGEYRFPKLVENIQNYLIVFDETQLRVNIYDLEKNSCVKSWKTKKNYNGIAAAGSEIAFHRDYYAGEGQESENAFDFYSIDGELLYTGYLLPYTNLKLLRELGLMHLGCVTQGANLLFSGSDDLKITAFNIERKRAVWQTQELPAGIYVNQVPGDKEFRRFVTHKLLSFQNGLNILELLSLNKSMVMYFAFYDNNGNYINYSKVDGGNYLTDGKYLYSVCQPEKINGKVTNYHLKKYEIVK